MSALPRRKQGSLHQKRILLSFFIAVALIAVAGFIVIQFQERNRVHLVAEYETYQLATLLLEEYQNSPSIDFTKIDNLVSFGVYSSRGDPIYKTALAPERVEASTTKEPVRFTRDKVRLVLRVGGVMGLRDGHMNRGEAPLRGIGVNPLTSRFFYIEYAAPALAQRVSLVSLAGILASFALVIAFVLIFILFRRLESYQANEAKNRELVALGEASRTLAHEIKNPLATILIRCGLIRKRFGEQGLEDATIIEGETNRIVTLVDTIREFLISGEEHHESNDQKG